MLVPTLPLYALTFESSFSLASLAVAATSIGTLLADVPSGMLLDRIGRKRAVMIGALVVAASSAGAAVAPTYAALIVFRVLAGFGTSLWNVSRMAHVATATTSQGRGSAMSTFGGITRLGQFGGPAVGGVIAAGFGLQAPFYITAAMALAAAIVGYVAIADDVRRDPAIKHLPWTVLRGVARTHWRELLTAGSAQIFAQMIRQGRLIIVPLVGATVLGLDVAQVGSVVSLSSAVDMALFIPAGMIMDRLGRKFAAVPSFTVMSIGMAIIPFAHDYTGLLIAVLVIGLGNGLGSGTMFTLGADLAPPEATGEFLGIWRLMGDSGSTGGPVIVGGIADLAGLGPAALVLAALGVLSALTLGLFVKETLDTGKPHVVAT